MKKNIIIIAAVLFLGTACTKFLSVNEVNPNVASKVAPRLILPAALNATANIMNSPGNWDFISLWYGTWCISGGYSQPNDFTQYNIRNTTREGNFSNFYINNANYTFIVNNSKSDPNLAYYVAISNIMMVHNYHVLVDCYGNVPYSEACKTDQGILKPKYDDAKTIYEDLVVKLDSAMFKIKQAPGTAENPGANDIMFQGDMTKWVKFANTLKLRILMHQTDMTGRIDAYIKPQMAKTVANGFLGAGEPAYINPGYLHSDGKMNPFYARFYNAAGASVADGVTYFNAGGDAIDFLKSTNDPRLSRLFQTATTGGYAGNYFGALSLLSPAATSYLGPGFIQAYNQPSVILSDFESLFLQAEAVQRGIITGDAKALYNAAVARSMAYLGVPGSDAAAAAYVAQDKAFTNFDASGDPKILIVTQKWIALGGITPIEVWTDFRRTGYPNFLHWSADKNKINPTPPIRLLYAQRELAQNGDNVKAVGTINTFTTKIFWQNH